VAIELTAKQVQAEKPSAVVKRIRDTKETGLCLVVAPSVTKSFSMQFTSPETGKRRYILIGTAKIGKSGDFSIKETRENARELKKLIRVGVDPVEQGIRDTKAEVRHLWNETGVDVMRKDSAITLKLILSTGQRTLEVLHAKWDEFNLEAGGWVIPFERRKVRYKAEHREPHVIPLCSLHVELLKELQGMTGRETYLFPKIRNNPDGTEEPRSHHVLQQTAVRYCTPKSGSVPCKRFSPRDLRRTMKTLSRKAGIDKELRDRLQGHTFQDVSSKNYDRYDYWPQKQQAMEQWCQYLETLVAGKNILPFRQDGAA